jgi:hypothetical protein
MIRKVCADNGEAIFGLFDEIENEIGSSAQKYLVSLLNDKLKQVRELTHLIMEQNNKQGAAAQGGAVEYLQAVAYTIGAWLWIKQLDAMVVLSDLQQARKQAAAEFYFEHLLPRVDGLVSSIKNGYDKVFALADELV